MNRAVTIFIRGSTALLLVTTQTRYVNASSNTVSGCVGNIAQEVCQLIDRWAIARENCQGFSDETKEEACDQQEYLSEELNTRGYTFGCQGDLGYQMYWRNDCKVQQAESMPINEFSCDGTAEMAVKIFGQSTANIITIKKVGIATIEKSDNLLTCKLIADGTIGGTFELRDSLIYTATLLDDGKTVWVEFPRSSSRSSSYSSMGTPLSSPSAPPIIVNSYTHRADSYIRE